MQAIKQQQYTILYQISFINLKRKQWKKIKIYCLKSSQTREKDQRLQRLGASSVSVQRPESQAGLHIIEPESMLKESWNKVILESSSSFLLEQKSGFRLT